MRQTDFSLEALLDILNAEPEMKIIPDCMALNEIGEIFFAGGEESKEAEEALLELIDDPVMEKQFCALCWLLSDTTKLSQEALQKINEFKADSNNQSLVLMAEQAVREVRAELN